jgi:hypothetical protein
VCADLLFYWPLHCWFGTGVRAHAPAMTRPYLVVTVGTWRSMCARGPARRGRWCSQYVRSCCGVRYLLVMVLLIFLLRRRTAPCASTRCCPFTLGVVAMPRFSVVGAPDLVRGLVLCVALGTVTASCTLMHARDCLAPAMVPSIESSPYVFALTNGFVAQGVRCVVSALVC